MFKLKNTINLIFCVWLTTTSLHAQRVLVIAVEGDDYLMTHIEEFIRNIKDPASGKFFFDNVVNLSRIEENNQDINTTARVLVKSSNGLLVDLSTSLLDEATSAAISKYDMFLKIKINPLVELIEYQFNLYKRQSSPNATESKNIITFPNNNQRPFRTSNYFINPKIANYLKDIEHGIYKLFPETFIAPKADILINGKPIKNFQTYKRLMPWFACGDTIILEARFNSKTTDYDHFSTFEWTITPQQGTKYIEENGNKIKIALSEEGSYQFQLRTKNEVNSSTYTTTDVMVINRPIITPLESDVDIFIDQKSIFLLKKEDRLDHKDNFGFVYKASNFASENAFQINSLLAGKPIPNPQINPKELNIIDSNKYSSILIYSLDSNTSVDKITFHYNLSTLTNKYLGKTRYDYRIQLNSDGLSSSIIDKSIFVSTYSPIQIGSTLEFLYSPSIYPATIYLENTIIKKRNAAITYFSVIDFKLRLLPYISLSYYHSLSGSYFFSEDYVLLNTVNNEYYEFIYNNLNEIKNGLGFEFEVPVFKENLSSAFFAKTYFTKFKKHQNLEQRYQEAINNLGQQPVQTYAEVISNASKRNIPYALMGFGVNIRLFPFIIPIRLNIGSPIYTSSPSRSPNIGFSAPSRSPNIGFSAGILLDVPAVLKLSRLKTQKRYTQNFSEFQ
ncbi:MAG: hypothetical protein JNJ57_10980 [Saprospiraceae bacterium]|nr:hypothetical protein [Saprospiraceae bacterium]